MDALPFRKTIRLPQMNYTQNGAYFVTTCLKPRIPLLGSVVGAGPRPARVELTSFGKIVEETWLDLPNHNCNMTLGPFVVMPDHVHGILILEGRAGLGPAPTALSEIMRQFKTFSARRINALRKTPGAPLWQRSYYEHVIRNQQDLDETAAYILGNPARWAERENNM